MITLQQVKDHAALCEHDDWHVFHLYDALKETGLWERMGGVMPKKKLNVAPPKAPAKEAITAMRAAIFDNWPQGAYVKKHPNRYAMALELWDLPAQDIEAVKVKSLNYTFKCNMALMGRKSFLSQIRNLKKPRKNELSTVDHTYLETLTAMAEANPTALFGLLNTAIGDDESEFHRGVYYHPDQFVMVTMVGEKVESAMLIINNEITDFAPFVSRDWAGDAFKGNVIAQSRTDIVGFDESWGSR